MYITEAAKRLSDGQMRYIATTLKCSVSEVGAPTVDGKWHYWIEKELDPPTDRPVIEKCNLRPLLLAKDEAIWDAA